MDDVIFEAPFAGMMLLSFGYVRQPFGMNELLARRPDQLVLHRELLRDVWAPQDGDEGNYLRVFIAQIRKKLEPMPERPRDFITEPGIGYRLEHTITRGSEG